MCSSDLYGGFDTGNANEFPRINLQRTARPYRYAYIASNPLGQQSGLQQRISRVDLETGKAASHDFAPDGYVGEPVFIPTGTSGEEDDGIVVTLVFDTRDNCTAIVALDARDLTARPLFTAKLKHHVPFSLHGVFTPRLFGG